MEIWFNPPHPASHYDIEQFLHDFPPNHPAYLRGREFILATLRDLIIEVVDREVRPDGDHDEAIRMMQTVRTIDSMIRNSSSRPLMGGGRRRMPMHPRMGYPMGGNPMRGHQPMVWEMGPDGSFQPIGYHAGPGMQGGMGYMGRDFDDYRFQPQGTPPGFGGSPFVFSRPFEEPLPGFGSPPPDFGGFQSHSHGPGPDHHRRATGGSEGTGFRSGGEGPDLYAALEIKRNATKEEIEKQGKKMKAKWHPDRNKEAGAEDKFKLVNTATEWLTDEQKRKFYDMTGSTKDSEFEHWKAMRG